MRKILTLILFTYIGQVQACPMCMSNDPNGKYFFYIILTFILVATLVILYLLRVCIKYRNINKLTYEK